SAVNVRTSTASIAEGRLVDADFSGTYFLEAAGSISQVGGSAGRLPLSADKVSLASMGAVFMTGLVLRSESEDSPNLQIVAGAPRSLGTTVGDGQAMIGDRYVGQDIPTPTKSTFAPVLVEIDDEATGVRGPLVEPRDSGLSDADPRRDFGFEDLLVPLGEDESRNARISETLPNGESAQHDLPSMASPGSRRTIDDDYSAVVIVEGSAVVGDVADATGTVAEANDVAMGARGFEVTSAGNGFLRAVEGDLTFTSANREVLGESFVAPSSATVVQMGGGVFTAVADQTLSIDTVDANTASDTARTSLLRSSTDGVVSSVKYLVDPGDPEAGVDPEFRFGPRVFLDPSSEQADAATTGLVRADTSFEQRVTLAVGSRSENNVLVEIEWADVAKIREASAANPIPLSEPVTERDDFPTSLPGSTEFADLTQVAVEEIEIPLDSEDRIDSPDVVFQELGEGPESFRVATLRHNFQVEFVPSNPAQETLPTTVRVYNDPFINLYDNAAEEVRDLNSASLTFAPRIIAVEGGFFLPIESETIQKIVPREVMVLASEPITYEQQTTSDVGRAVVTSNAESLEFGRLDREGEWLDEIPGEEWPQVREDLEGDYLREVRDFIDDGPFSEGTYRIQIVTPRGEQVLEEWIKGDLGEDGAPIEVEEVWEDFDGGETVPEVLPETLSAIENADALPIDRFSRREVDDASHHAANAAFAAMATVGGWRRRLTGTGAFRLDEDGVAFTRARRRQRKRLGLD
ncbi:MAG: hypothetical protein AAF266_16090, partial [Planctomycetota bacterium]